MRALLPQKKASCMHHHVEAKCAFIKVIVQNWACRNPFKHTKRWKGWACYFCFFNKTSCLHAIYLNNHNHLLPPPLLFPFGEKEPLEITSVSCEFWRRSQEYKAHASVDRSDPPGERSDTAPFPCPGQSEQSGASSTFYRSRTGSQGANFPCSCSWESASPCLGWGCTFTIPVSRGQCLESADETQCSRTTPANVGAHVWSTLCRPMTCVLQSAPSLECPLCQVCSVSCLLDCVVFNIAEWRGTKLKANRWHPLPRLANEVDDTVTSFLATLHQLCCRWWIPEVFIFQQATLVLGFFHSSSFCYTSPRASWGPGLKFTHVKL